MVSKESKEKGSTNQKADISENHTFLYKKKTIKKEDALLQGAENACLRI